MALEVKENIVINDPDGLVSEFTDVTGVYSTNNTGGYGTPNIDYGDVEMVRVKVGNYQNISTEVVIGQAGLSLGQYYEYLKTEGTPKVYDGKTISVGQYFIPHTTGLTVQSGDVFVDTGYYSAPTPPATFLPANTNPILYLNSRQLGQYGSPSVISDNLISAQYEVYDSLQIGGSAVVDVTYMAYSSTVTYGGNTYRLGEVFTASAATAITGTVVKLASSVSQDFVLTYNIDKAINELVIRAKSGDCSCYDDIIEGVLRVRLLLDGLKWQAKSGTLSWMKGQDILDYCTQKINELTNSSCF
jgi:hypothetical protein